ncbi:Uncharacterised protein [Vibrio cholerae]|nr:Uncharacterised protein [Vibrio cholerae]CSI31804.1 Uncharacterised protein [Vibrio cholerae]
MGGKCCQNSIQLIIFHLNHGAKLFIEQCRQCIITQGFNIGFNTTVTRESHFCQRHQ